MRDLQQVVTPTRGHMVRAWLCAKARRATRRNSLGNVSLTQETQKLPEVRVLGGRWELQSPLARGGMGVLYVGRHLQTGRRAALKVIDRASEEMLARFRVEASVCAQIGH